MSTFGQTEREFRPWGTGKPPKCALIPGQRMLDRRRISAGLSHLVERYHSVSFCAFGRFRAVNVGVFQDSRFFCFRA